MPCIGNVSVSITCVDCKTFGYSDLRSIVIFNLNVFDKPEDQREFTRFGLARKRTFKNDIFQTIIMVQEEKKNIGHLFDGIAVTYDKLNHLLSLNIDKSWR